MAVPSLSLYLHIPFCSKKCSYCSFYSRCASPGEEETFVEQLIRELTVKMKVMNPLKVPSVFIGGGTPSSLSPELLLEILERTEDLLPGPPEEWTIEVNPESLDEEHLTVFRQGGITRISMGIQSFQPAVLKTLGRSAGPEEINRALNLISDCWSGQWSGDLICEVPGQTADQAAADVDALCSHHPDHISLYTLSIEEGTPLEARVNSGAVSGDTDPEIWFDAAGRLESNGYSRYEISNFCLPGKECLHNLGYWKMQPFLGVGPSAASTLPGPAGPVRITNRPDLSGYLLAENPGDFGEKEKPDFPRFLMEYLLMGLRLISGISAAEIQRVFGYPLETMLPEWTSGNLRSGRLVHQGGFWRLAGSGLDFMDAVLLEAEMELDTLAQRIQTGGGNGRGAFPIPSWP